MPVRISVLGDVAMQVDGRLIDLGHARRKSVFISLLTDASRLVPVDELIGRVWGPRPPQSARSTLYTYLSRLRTALSPAGQAANVHRQTDGYVLALDERTAATVDLHRFHELTAQANAATDDDTALALLEEALSLWEGDAFGALRSPWIDELRESLRRKRLRAHLDRNELLLRQGRQTKILGDLLSLARQEPLNERVIGQLMVTLYREGRTSQALDYYERTRQTLVREKGTVPGLDLSDIHLRIRNADPALDTPTRPAAAVSPRAAVPSEPGPVTLPAAPPVLAGRAAALAELDDGQSATTPPVVVITGLGGIGKTSLALRWAHDNASRFPDGQLYINLHGYDPTVPAMTPSGAVRDLLVTLGVEQRALPARAEAQYALFRGLLAHRRMLLLLDNAHDAEHVRPLLPGSPTCSVVITSRDRLNSLVAHEGARPLALDVLSPEASRQFLATQLGERRTAAEPHAVGAIIDSCGRMPLALASAAARGAARPQFPLSALADELRAAETRLDTLETGDPLTSLRRVFDASYNALPYSAARVLGLVSLAPGRHIELSAAAALTGLTPSRTQALLSSLESAHLVNQTSPGRYELHELVRLTAAERCVHDQSAEERSEALHSLVTFYVRTAASAGESRDAQVTPSAAVAGVSEDAETVQPSCALFMQSLCTSGSEFSNDVTTA